MNPISHPLMGEPVLSAPQIPGVFKTKSQILLIFSVHLSVDISETVVLNNVTTEPVSHLTNNDFLISSNIQSLFKFLGPEWDPHVILSWSVDFPPSLSALFLFHLNLLKKCRAFPWPGFCVWDPTFLWSSDFLQIGGFRSVSRFRSGVLGEDISLSSLIHTYLIQTYAEARREELQTSEAPAEAGTHCCQQETPGPGHTEVLAELGTKAWPVVGIILGTPPWGFLGILSSLCPVLCPTLSTRRVQGQVGPAQAAGVISEVATD